MHIPWSPSLLSLTLVVQTCLAADACHRRCRGTSVSGSLDAAPLPAYLGDSAPWEGLAPGVVPWTNVTRYYNFTLSRASLAPDGYRVGMLVANKQFLGPRVEANWGDWIEVTVHNDIADPPEGTSIHWHGVRQRGTPYEDGVPGVSQWPIAPGHSYTYRFRAEDYGTSFWHSHFSAQYTKGLSGPIVIYGPTHEYEEAIDLGEVMISDWAHQDYEEIVRGVVSADFSPPVSESGLINGRGRYDCSGIEDSSLCSPNAPYSAFRFYSGKLHRLRLINHGADGVQKFSIDQHTMTVTSLDFEPVVPYNATTITLGVGQRVEVVVEANGSSRDSFWMRSQMPGGLFCGGNDNTNVIRAAIYYEKADMAVEPESLSAEVDPSCVNSPLTVTEPLFAVEPSKDFIQTDITLALQLNATGSFVWTMNDMTFRADYEHPLLFNEERHFPPESVVFNYSSNTSVIFNITNTTPFQHPLHLHGYHFQILSSGPDTATSVYPATDANPLSPPPPTVWNGDIMGSKSNPIRRDTHIIPALGYAAFQVKLDNPGIWPFHCHTAWHQSAGMNFLIATGLDDIQTTPLKEIMDRTKPAWLAYSQTHTVNQIDAGA